MPIIRKVMQVGTSKAITLPKGWLDYFEKETGFKISEVAIDIDRVLRVSPVFEKKTVKNDSNSKTR